MKINPTGRPNFIQGGGYRASGIGAYNKTQAMRRDEATLSEEAISFSKVFSEVKDAASAKSPDEVSRIAELREQIAAGTYRVDSEDIADSILGSLFG